MTNDASGESASGGREYDLEERTARFGEATIDFLKAVPANRITGPLITQLCKAATSVGANYAEADEAESRRDFRHKLSICRKEARECKHFFRMMARAAPDHRDAARELWQEAKELHLIFCKSIRRIGETDR